MSSLLRSKKFILGTLAALIAIGAWLGLSQSSAPAQSSAISTTGVLGDAVGSGDISSVEGNNIVGVLLTLRAVKLEGTIFSEQTFRSLKDFSTPIVPEPVGRQDPFAPNTSASAAPDTTHTARLFKTKR